MKCNLIWLDKQLRSTFLLTLENLSPILSFSGFLATVEDLAFGYSMVLGLKDMWDAKR
jgi:hypothetical protein